MHGVPPGSRGAAEQRALSARVSLGCDSERGKSDTTESPKPKPVPPVAALPAWPAPSVLWQGDPRQHELADLRQRRLLQGHLHPQLPGADSLRRRRGGTATSGSQQMRRVRTPRVISPTSPASRASARSTTPAFTKKYKSHIIQAIIMILLHSSAGSLSCKHL